MHRAVFAWSSQQKKKTPGDFVAPAHYSCLRSFIYILQRLGIKRDDTVIVAIDGRGNWRKDIVKEYKGNRKDLREKSGIDWGYWFDKFNVMIEKLKESTPFHYIRLDKIEADDIISAGCRKFSDSECIIVSSDSDFEQLAAYPNVKIFSPLSKGYKIVKNPYKVLRNKIKREASDNLISPVVTEDDYKKREMVVSLLKLPEVVEEKVLDSLENLCYNEFNPELFPFASLVNKFEDIYNSKKIQNYAGRAKPKKKKQKRKAKKNVQSPQTIF